MENPIFILQTSWPNIRIALFRRNDGHFQFLSQVLRASGYESNHESGLYDDETSARADMRRFADDFEGDNDWI